jgi:drug/metabolite transporter (DMT)-like permease
MGVALIPLGAVLFLDEGVSYGAGAGIAVVVAGIYLVQTEDGGLRGLVRPLRGVGRPAAAMALLTGVLIASYSLWDKNALDHLSPVTLFQFSMTGHTIVLAPLALQGGGSALRLEWRERKWSIIAAAAMGTIAYILVLYALTSSQVAYIGPTREVGIVLGALLGVLLLREGFGVIRVAGSVLILTGALAIGLSP